MEVSVLFVCLGNICRSPLAEGIFKHKTVQMKHIKSDSCGTSSYHLGSQPDSRSLKCLQKHNIIGYKHNARQLCLQDFHDFDYILCMDKSNLRDIKELQASGSSNGKAIVKLLGEFSHEKTDLIVGDPYYGADDGFEVNFQQCTRAIDGLLSQISKQ